MKTDPQLENAPYRPNQFWRVFSSLFAHAGLVQVIFSVGLQYFIGADIENQAGWVRVLIIYAGSALGGNLFSAIFIPYQITMGADPAVFGLIAVTFVDV